MSTSEIKVVRLEPMPPWITQRMAGEFDVVHLDAPSDRPAALLENAQQVRAVATPSNIGAGRALLELFPKLEIVACFGVGVDLVATDYAKENGIVVSNTPGVLTECVADLGMGLVLATLRCIVAGDRFVRTGRWPVEFLMALTRSPRGRKLGIVGLGAIGMALAQRAQAFGMEICYHNRNRRDDVEFDYFAGVLELAAAVDVLALTCPGGEATHHMIDAEVLAALGSQGVLINIARGTVVDEAALVQALQGDVISAAGIDVFEAEPEVPKALFALDNVVLQPHQASATVETRGAMGDLCIDNLIAHFTGGNALNPVEL